MKALKDHRFWIGFALGYLLLVVFPQANFRAMGGKKKKGGTGL